MSHEDSTLDFQQGATMIYGLNLTDEGQVSNGSGKSAILEGIALCLTGNTLRKVSAKDLVRSGEKTAIVDLVLENEKTDRLLRVRRIIHSNTKSAELMIKINEENPTDLVVNAEDKVDVRDGNAWIIRELDISKDDLLNFFIVSKEKYSSFLTSGDTDKKKIIDRFSQSNLVDPVFDQLSATEELIKQEIRASESHINKNQGKIDLLREQQEKDTEDIFKQEKEANIKAIQSRIDELQARIPQAEKEALSKSDDMSNIEELIEELPNTDGLEKNLSGVNDKINAHIKLYRESEAEVKETTKLIREQKVLIAGSIECPKCNHEFILGEDVNITETKSLISQLSDLLTELTLKSNKLESQGSIIRVEQKDIEDLIREAAANKSRLNRSLTSIKSDIESIFSRITRIEKNIEDETTRLNTESTKTYQADETRENQIKVLQDEIQGFEKDIEDKKEELVSNLEWIGYMKKFKAHLANKAIKAIETMANEYLSRMKTNLSLSIEGFKINRNKKIVEKITVSVMRDGIEEGLFDKFSTGEKTRIEISCILALQKLINANSQGLDLCFLDEVIDGLDSQGIRDALKVLQSLDQTIMVITHGSLDQQATQYIEVKKELGVSKIYQ